MRPSAAIIYIYILHKYKYVYIYMNISEKQANSPKLLAHKTLTTHCHLRDIYGKSERKIRKLYCERETKHQSFPALRKTQTQNKFMSLCFSVDASKSAEDTTSQATREKGRWGLGPAPSEHEAVLLFYTANSCDIPRYENR